jgi:spore coat protein CotH
MPGDGAEPSTGEQGPPAGFGGGSFGGGNVLVERFHATPELEAMYEEQLDELTQLLYESGQAEEALLHRTQVLTDIAGDLLDATTIEEEAQHIRDVFRRG